MKFFNFEFAMILSGITIIALLWEPFWNWYLNRKTKDCERDIIDSTCKQFIGEKYLSGTITIDGVEHHFIAWKNKYKNSDKHMEDIRNIGRGNSKCINKADKEIL